MTDGDALIEEVVSPDGDHRYVPPPTDGVATNGTVSPSQIAVAPLVVTLGVVATVTVLIAGELTQPNAVYVTEYVVLEAGLTVILAVVSPPGDHK